VQETSSGTVKELEWRLFFHGGKKTWWVVVVIKISFAER